MKKRGTAFLIILCILSTMTLAFSVSAEENIPETNWTDYADVNFAAESGDGNTEGTAYLIENAGQLAYLAKTVNEGNNYEGKHFKITTNIDLKDHLWTPIGQYEEESENTIIFRGNFDGQDYVISNLTISAPNSDYQGLFGFITNRVYTKNINLVDCNITGNNYVGGIAGFSFTRFRNCISTGTVNGNNYVGGLTGLFEGVGIYDCYSSCDVFGGSNVGGMVGDCMDGVIENCYATGNVTATGDNVGGLFGLSSAEMTSCYATGNIVGANNIGGLIGNGVNTINECYATGNVQGEKNVGGFVGFGEGLIIEDCYANGDVIGEENIGGFAGYLFRQFGSSRITGCYANGNVTATGDNIGGFIGHLGKVSDRLDILIYSCYAKGNVEGNDNIGGLIGYLCSGGFFGGSSSGSVTGNDNIGGLIGKLFLGRGEHNYTTSNVTGNNNVGGVLGNGDNDGLSNYIKHSYSSGNVIGFGEYIGGFAGIFLGSLSYSYTYSLVSGNNKAGAFAGNLGIKTLEDEIHNIYYDNTINNGKAGIFENAESLQYAEGHSTEQMKSERFVDNLIDPISFAQWAFDIFQNVNNGYPILDRQRGQIPRWTDSEIVAKSFAAGSGDGDTEATAYLIETAEQLAYFSKTLNEGNVYRDKYIKLIADIDLQGRLWTSIGGGRISSNASNMLLKSFDGGGFSIKNLTTNNGSGLFVGIFGREFEPPNRLITLKNINLIDCNIKNGGGALIGRTDDVYVYIENCTATGTVSSLGDTAGGLIGSANYTTMYNCHSDVDVTAYHAGGLVGNSHYENSFENCSAMGNVYGETIAGGFVGTARNDSSFEASFASGEVFGNGIIGGFSGNGNNANFNNCYATGNVYGESNTGGFIGISNNSSVYNCYSAGKVDATSSENVGAFAGVVNDDIDNSYCNLTVNQGLNVIGGGSSSVNSKTTIEMKAAYFVELLNDIQPEIPWRTDIKGLINDGYPILKWQAETVKNNKFDVEFTITNLSTAYTDSPQTPTITPPSALDETDYTVTYKDKSDVGAVATKTPPTEIGTYDVEITLNDEIKDYFNVTGNTAVFEIYKRQNSAAVTSSGVGQVTAAPTASVQSGEVKKGTAITLSSPTEGANIYYTLDGTNPTINSMLYTAPIIIDKDTNIKFIALKSGISSSQIVSLNYTVSAKVAINTDFAIKENASTIKYMSGYSDNTFKPDQAITRYEMLEALNNLLDFSKNGSHNLTDVTADYDKLVPLFTGAGIIEGYDDNTFKGTDGLTRAEFVKILSVILNLEIKESSENKFTDISTHWAKDYINSFEELNYLKGYDDGTFKPDNKLTRAEFTTIINRIINSSSELSNDTFTDLSPDHWAYDEISKSILK